MDVARILEAASLVVPEEVATDNDVTVADVWDHLAHDEWEVAIDLLQELGDVASPPPDFWDGLGRAARQLGLERSRAWCDGRSCEARAGIIRADLVLVPAGETFRHTPISGAGVLRPMWDIGNRKDGEPALDIAAVWVESAKELAPGGRAPVRLLPLDPNRWQHVVPGDTVTMYECALAGGTATILEVHPVLPSPA